MASAAQGHPAQGDALVISLGQGKQSFRRLADGKAVPVDVVFPILHGTFGEDGCIQGLLRMAEIPFVGADVTGSAIGMDKAVCKRLLAQAEIPSAKYLALRAGEAKPEYQTVSKQLGKILFVKPAKQGSSVGISKVTEQQQWRAALDEAFRYDDEILIEEFIRGREIEVSVLGNENPRASLPGEIIPNADFYSYDAKYIDANGAALKVPVELDAELISAIQTLAVKTYKILCGQGMARVDFFLQDRALYVNEVNTIPGFTPISMYPKLWDVSGLPMPGLLDQLIQLAMQRATRQNSMQRSFSK